MTSEIDNQLKEAKKQLSEFKKLQELQQLQEQLQQIQQPAQPQQTHNLPKFNLFGSANQPKSTPVVNKFSSSIPKKTCAVEVVKHLNSVRILGIGSIVGIFFILLASTFGRGIGYAVALIIVIGAGVMTGFSTKELKRIKTEYGLK